MAELPEIPLENATPLELLRSRPHSARLLVASAADNFSPAVRLAAKAAIRLADGASRAWLARQDNPYLGEIDAMALALKSPGLYALNVCFEWGCTSGVWPSARGPAMHRTMDWPFPGLGENMVVLRQKGPAGEFLTPTWPGMAGPFQGLAPGRFAAAINQAPMRLHGKSPFDSWLKNRVLVKRTSALPPAHLLRSVLENAPDYQAARTLLCETPIALPAIFILSGLCDGEGCVIERLEERFAVREMGLAGVCATNHFQTELADGDWRAREIDSMGRARCAAGLSRADFAAEFGWFVPPIANAYSRLALNARAQDGSLALMGTAGAKAVTQTLRFQGC